MQEWIRADAFSPDHRQYKNAVLGGGWILESVMRACKAVCTDLGMLEGSMGGYLRCARACVACYYYGTFS